MAIESGASRVFESDGLHRAGFDAQPRTILCATDLSSRSERATKMAAVLANQLGAQLMLLHVVATAKVWTAARPAREHVRARLRSWGPRLGSIPVLALRTGDVAKSIAQVASEAGAGLIVLGTQRKRPLATVLGTTAERVVARAPCPVLVVRSSGSLRNNRVVFATDLTPAFRKLVDYAHRWSFLDVPSVSIVHGFAWPYQGPRYAEGYDVEAARHRVSQWKQTVRGQLFEMLDAAGIDGSQFDVRIEERRPLRAVRRALRHGGPSLLILGTSDHNALTRVFRGSLVNDVLLGLDCDVLICPPDASTPAGAMH